MKVKNKLLVAAVCALATSAGYANPMTVDVRFGENVFKDSGSVAVALKVGGDEITGVAAGRFQGTALNVTGVPESIFVDSLDHLFAYCYDIYDPTYAKEKNTYSIKLDGETARTLKFVGAVNFVLNAENDIYDQFAWLHPTSRYQGAAIQLGIWESLYETKDLNWDLRVGNFSASGVRGASGDWSKTDGWWKTFLSAMDSSTSLDGDYVMVLASDRRQDLITADPPLAVPEPGSLALLGLGLGGLFWVRHRKMTMVD